ILASREGAARVQPLWKSCPLSEQKPSNGGLWTYAGENSLPAASFLSQTPLAPGIPSGRPGRAFAELACNFRAF
ncbi:MAG TPA: hypothetical protein VFA26_23715, partial [Gemmataceae bacterium]|nr:hypothetical protein [Gemmataceae bacterium]